MENASTDEDLIAHLSTSNERFQFLTEQHAQYKEQIRAIEAKAYVTGLEEAEEQRLKKLKLQAKDEMNQMVAHHRHAAAGATAG